MRIVRSACFTAVASFVALWAASRPAQAADPRLYPNDTEFVFTLNLKQIVESPLVQAQKEPIDQAKAMIEQKIGDNPGQKYLKQAGFDPLKDLHSLTVAGPGSKDLNSGCIIIQGKFNVEKFNAAVEQASRDAPDLLKITKAGNHRIYEITQPGEKQFFVSLVSDSLLVACPNKDVLTDALSRHSGAKKSGLKKEFQTLLETVNNKQSISVVATGAALAKLMENSNDPNAAIAAQMVQQMEGLSGAITIAKDIQFQLGVNAQNAETAKQMAQFGNAGLFTVKTMAQQKAKEDAKFLPLVDVAKTLRITNQGNNVLLRGEMSLDVIEAIMKNLPNQ